MNGFTGRGLNSARIRRGQLRFRQLLAAEQTLEHGPAVARLRTGPVENQSRGEHNWPSGEPASREHTQRCLESERVLRKNQPMYNYSSMYI